MQKIQSVEMFLRKRENPSKKEKKVRLVCSLVLIDIIIWGVVFTSLPISTSFIVENPSPLRIDTVQAISMKPVEPVSIEDKIKAAFGDEAGIALAVAKSESGLRNVKGDIPLEYQYEGRTIGHSCGIFQIRVLPGRPNCEELMDVDTNIAYAKKIHDRVGFSAWSNFKNLRYLAFMQ